MPSAICTGKKYNIDDDALVNFTITQENVRTRFLSRATPINNPAKNRELVI